MAQVQMIQVSSNVLAPNPTQHKETVASSTGKEISNWCVTKFCECYKIMKKYSAKSHLLMTYAPLSHGLILRVDIQEQSQSQIKSES